MILNQKKKANVSFQSFKQVYGISFWEGKGKTSKTINNLFYYELLDQLDETLREKNK